ncbi:MAG: hypothetical protein DRO76_05710, partial [Candidatus Altiarchaeales archaeon]
FQLIRVWHITGKVEILTEEGCGDNKILLGILYFFDNDWDGRLTLRDILIEAALWVGTLGLGRVVLAAGKGTLVGARLVRLAAKSPKIARLLSVQAKFDDDIARFVMRSNKLSKIIEFLLRHPRLTKLLHIQSVVNTYIIKRENIKDWQLGVDRIAENKNSFFGCYPFLAPGLTWNERVQGFIWRAHLDVMFAVPLFRAEGILTKTIIQNSYLWRAAWRAHQLTFLDIWTMIPAKYFFDKETTALQWAMGLTYDLLGISDSQRAAFESWLMPSNPYLRDVWMKEGGFMNLPFWYRYTRYYEQNFEMLFTFSLMMDPLFVGIDRYLPWFAKYNPTRGFDYITWKMGKVPVVGSAAEMFTSMVFEEAVAEAAIAWGMMAISDKLSLSSRFPALGSLAFFGEFAQEILSEGHHPSAHYYTQEALSSMEEKYDKIHGKGAFHNEIKNAIRDIPLRYQLGSMAVIGKNWKALRSRIRNIGNIGHVEIGGETFRIDSRFNQAIFQNAKVWGYNGNFVTFQDFVELNYFGRTSGVNCNIIFLNEHQFTNFLIEEGYDNIDGFLNNFNTGSVLIGNTIVINSELELSLPDITYLCAKEIGVNHIANEYNIRTPNEHSLLNSIGVSVGTYTGMSLSNTYSNKLFQFFALNNFHRFQGTVDSKDFNQWMNSVNVPDFNTQTSSLINDIISFSTEFSLTPQTLTQVMSTNPHILQLALSGQLHQLQSGLKILSTEYEITGEVLTNIIGNQQLTRMIVSKQLQMQNIQALTKMGLQKPIVITAMSRNPHLAQMTPEQFSTLQREMGKIAAGLRISTTEMAPALSSSYMTQAIVDGNFPIQSIQTMSSELGISVTTIINAMGRNPHLAQIMTSGDATKTNLYSNLRRASRELSTEVISTLLTDSKFTEAMNSPKFMETPLYLTVHEMVSEIGAKWTANFFRTMPELAANSVNVIGLDNMVGLSRSAGAESIATFIKLTSPEITQQTITRVRAESLGEFIELATPEIAANAFGSNSQTVSQMITELGAKNSAKFIKIATPAIAIQRFEDNGVMIREMINNAGVEWTANFFRAANPEVVSSVNKIGVENIFR